MTVKLQTALYRASAHAKGTLLNTPSDSLIHLATTRGLEQLAWVGGGLEFSVFRGIDEDGLSWALRTPTGNRFQANANDPHIDSRALLTWEYAVTRRLADAGLPVAVPRELVIGETDVLISEYVAADGNGVHQESLGALLRQVHDATPPGIPPASEGLDSAQLIPQRISRRWRELTALVPELEPLVPVARLAAELADRPAGRLLHLDVRSDNLRCVGGQILGIIDWSNSLVAEPALEFGRLAELARIPSNGINFDAVMKGYAQPIDFESSAFWVYRLDAAVMLAVVFLSEAPDEALGRHALARVREVHRRLAFRLDT